MDRWTGAKLNYMNRVRVAQEPQSGAFAPKSGKNTLKDRGAGWVGKSGHRAPPIYMLGAHVFRGPVPPGSPEPAGVLGSVASLIKKGI